MKEVISCLEKRTRKQNRSFIILVTLDVRNAFNSARWPKIIEAMDEMGISEYLIGTTKSYLDMLDSATLVGFADDIGTVVTASTEEELKRKARVAVESATIWVTNTGLKIAPE